jgi:PAS domain S-box-containing protein
MPTHDENRRLAPELEQFIGEHIASGRYRTEDEVVQAGLRLLQAQEDGSNSPASTLPQTNAALRESEARFRHMADSAPALIWMTDALGQFTFANMHHDHIFGRPAADMLGEGWKDVIVPEDLERYEAAFLDAFHARQRFSAEVRVRDKNGQVRWLRCEGVPRLDDLGRFLGYTGCSVDVTERKQAEEHLRLLNRELGHRVKNLLATIQALASQTFRDVGSLPQAHQAFSSRLGAMANAHELLVQQNWKGASLTDIVEATVQAHGGGENRFQVSGPRVRLSAKMALSLSMALHELATNAVKYGALSNEAGQVEITWKVTKGPEDRHLTMLWEESGGPPVVAPARKGFGSRLIERSLAAEVGGEAQIRYEPTGIICIFDAPLQSA